MFAHKVQHCLQFALPFCLWAKGQKRLGPVRLCAWPLSLCLPASTLWLWVPVPANIYIRCNVERGAWTPWPLWALLLLFAVVWLLLVLAKPCNCAAIWQCSLPQITMQTQGNCIKVSGCFWRLKWHPKAHTYSVGQAHTCHAVSACFYWMQTFLHLVRKKFGLCLVFYLFNNSGHLGKGCFAKLPE